MACFRGKSWQSRAQLVLMAFCWLPFSQYGIETVEFPNSQQALIKIREKSSTESANIYGTT